MVSSLCLLSESDYHQVIQMLLILPIIFSCYTYHDLSWRVFSGHHSEEEPVILAHPNRYIAHHNYLNYLSIFNLSYQNSQFFDTTFQHRIEPSFSVTNRYSGYTGETAMDVMGEPVSSRSKTSTEHTC